MKRIWKAFVAWCKASTINHRIDKTTDGLYYVRWIGNKNVQGRAVSDKRHLTPGGAVAEAQALGLEVEST